MSAVFAVGIDLGTTNSVVAYRALESAQSTSRLLPIPQFVDSSTIESPTSLPSFVYLGTANEQFSLPWTSSESESMAIGAFARKRSAQVPDRTIVAAKSWLSHHRVDRRAPLLPHTAADDIDKKSPVAVSQAILKHLVDAWHHAHPDTPLAQQHVTLTVPASFDASARDLTREAALSAGLPDSFIMMEEPQAALYAWLEQRESEWRNTLAIGDTLLVVDVGGGTTDFSLIAVEDTDGELALNRLAVGKHLLVGGDNMDLTLAHVAGQAFQAKGQSLDAWQNVSLWHSCRQAKEKLLVEGGVDSQTLSIAGRGRSLIGGSITIELQRATVQSTLVDGFFPVCDYQAMPQSAMMGFQEVGLPYEADPAITRHLAQFLRSHLHEGQGVTHVLFNGGVFKATVFQSRILEVLAQWFRAAPICLDSSADLDASVSRGAAYYAQSKSGKGIRIRGGTAQAYYIGFQSAGMAIPGMPRPMNALCVIPMGLEEGSRVTVEMNPIGLVVGQETNFPFYASTTRDEDNPGVVLSAWQPDELVESENLRATLSSTGVSAGEQVSVTLEAALAETGALELWAVSTESDERWKLEFNTRAASPD